MIKNIIPENVQLFCYYTSLFIDPLEILVLFLLSDNLTIKILHSYTLTLMFNLTKDQWSNIFFVLQAIICTYLFEK